MIAPAHTSKAQELQKSKRNLQAGPSNLLNQAGSVLYNADTIDTTNLKGGLLTTHWVASANAVADDVLTIQFSGSVDVGSLLLVPGDGSVMEIDIYTGTSDVLSNCIYHFSGTTLSALAVIDRDITRMHLVIKQDYSEPLTLRMIGMYEEIHLGSDSTGYFYSNTIVSAQNSNAADLRSVVTSSTQSSTNPVILQ